MPQRTIAREISLTGRGLFSGEEVTLTVSPAAADSGINFIRQMGGATTIIPAHISSLLELPRRTVLRSGSMHVETVEHFLAALAGLGITNARVTIDGGKTGELPMGDGSAQPFVTALNDAGLTEQTESVDPLIINRPVHIIEGDTHITALPGPKDRLEITYEFEGPEPVGRQIFSFHAGSDDFVTQLAPARTFSYEAEAKAMWDRGMGRHLTPKDVLVIGPGGPIDNAFRFANECARHKALDVLGDLQLVGRPVCGRIVAYKSGHTLNHKLARKLVRLFEAERRVSLLRGDGTLDLRQIQRILPHRYPMLLVDRVLEIEGNRRAVGVKNVSFNDPFLQGHYPGSPIMPGVLIVEAMAQLGGILLSRQLEHTGKIAVLLSMDKVKLRRPVLPGDQLILEAEAIRVRTRTGHMKCRAFVLDKPAAEAEIKFMLVDPDRR